MEIDPNWRETEIEQLIEEHQLFVMMSPGGWWFELPSGKHLCLSEYLANAEIYSQLKKWVYELK